MTAIDYISPNYRRGQNRRVGNLHLHVDLARTSPGGDNLVDVAIAFERAGLPCKVTSISRAIMGSHFRDPRFAKIYADHTPELANSGATFVAYLTAQVAPEAFPEKAVPELVARIQTSVRDIIGAMDVGEVVVEIERSHAALTLDGLDPAGDGIRTIATDDVLFEVHHLVDFERRGLSVVDWAERVAALGLSVGGWFQFDRPEGTAFRSVRFHRQLDLGTLAQDQAHLRRAAQRVADGTPHRVETVAEQILAIWRMNRAHAPARGVPQAPETTFNP